MTLNGEIGTYFAVFAPAAKSVKVIGDFNHWSADGTSELFVQWNGSGIWEGFIPGIQAGALYKYSILSNHDDKVREKADPYMDPGCLLGIFLTVLTTQCLYMNSI